MLSMELLTYTVIRDTKSRKTETQDDKILCQLTVKQVRYNPNQLLLSEGRSRARHRHNTEALHRNVRTRHGTGADWVSLDQEPRTVDRLPPLHHHNTHNNVLATAPYRLYVVGVLDLQSKQSGDPGMSHSYHNKVFILYTILYKLCKNKKRRADWQ